LQLELERFASNLKILHKSRKMQMHNPCVYCLTDPAGALCAISLTGSMATEAATPLTYQTSDGAPLRYSDSNELSTNTMTPKRKFVLAGLGAALMFAAIFMFGGASPLSNTMLKASTCGPCTFKECVSSMCDPDNAPYQCTKGGAASGCASEADMWPGYSECDACCDMTDCADAIKAGDAGGDLPRQW
jgi:hypothetical protein